MNNCIRYSSQNTFIPKFTNHTKNHFKFSKNIKFNKLYASAHGENPKIPIDSYLALGLAHCYERIEGGKLNDKMVIEPIAAASLECMAAGAKTSFKHVTGINLETALKRNTELFPEEFSKGLFCESYEERCQAAARTWTRTHAQDNLMDIVPLGQMKSNFNYTTKNLERILNFENIVTDDDNIKQDMSIDVYGRNKEEEEGDKNEDKNDDDDKNEDDDIESLLAS